jgi:putative ABC transport system substrate-binding protein
MPCTGAYRFIFIILPVLLLLFHGNAEPADIRPPKVAIVISQPIKPYLIAVEGLREELAREGRAKIEEFDLKGFKGKSRNILAQDLKKGRFDLFIAIGPSAARFVWSTFPSRDVQKLYTMVLNPEGILAPEQPACGITLRIPVKTQIQLISSGLPSVKKLGVLYDPVYNAEFVNQASGYAPDIDFEIIPLVISSRKEIPIVLKQNWKKLNALLLIPDRTVISERIVQYIIKEAILKKVAVIGYNRFFYESGAALAFILDYREIGRQTGILAFRMLSGEGCKKVPPLFHAWVNRRVIQKLGIEFPREYKLPLEVGP